MRTVRSVARSVALASTAALVLAACGDAPTAAPAAPAPRPSLDIAPGPGTTVPAPITVWVKLHVGDQASYGAAGACSMLSLVRLRRKVT